MHMIVKRPCHLRFLVLVLHNTFVFLASPFQGLSPVPSSWAVDCLVQKLCRVRSIALSPLFILVVCYRCFYCFRYCLLLSCLSHNEILISSLHRATTTAKIGFSFTILAILDRACSDEVKSRWCVFNTSETIKIHENNNNTSTKRKRGKRTSTGRPNAMEVRD